MLSGIRLGAVAACWLLIAAVLILEFWPDLPRTHTGWFTFIVVGPPLYVLAEAFGGWLFLGAPRQGDFAQAVLGPARAHRAGRCARQCGHDLVDLDPHTRHLTRTIHEVAE